MHVVHIIVFLDSHTISAHIIVFLDSHTISVCIASLLSQATPRWPNAGVRYIVECEKTFKFRNQFHHSTFIPVII